ncbi:MAG: hypothetical protein ACFFEA_00895 [Candidatus Thorarchaeota archaeon]
MIEVLLYGNLKELVKDSVPNVNAILLCEYIEGEHLQDLLGRLGLKLADVGYCYINNARANPNNVIHDRDTIELNQPGHLAQEGSN